MWYIFGKMERDITGKRNLHSPVGSCMEVLHFRVVLGRLKEIAPNGEGKGVCTYQPANGLYTEVSERHRLMLDACMKASCPVRVLYV